MGPAILGLLEAYLTVTLGFYSSTREISLTATRWVLSQLEVLASSSWITCRNLVVLAVIILLAYVTRLIKLIFGQILGDVKMQVLSGLGRADERIATHAGSCPGAHSRLPYFAGSQKPGIPGSQYLWACYCLWALRRPWPMLSQASS